LAEKNKSVVLVDLPAIIFNIQNTRLITHLKVYGNQEDFYYFFCRKIADNEEYI